MDKAEVKSKLREYILRELLHNEKYPLADGEELIRGGLIDSFSVARIGVFIEEAFGVCIPDNDLTAANMDTLDQLAARVAAG